jgi:hypothetical protein
MDAFKAIYWKVHQLHAWVYTGDQQLVGEVADDAPKGKFDEELTLPDGRRKLTTTETNLRDPYSITMYATSNGTARTLWAAAEAEILTALCIGKLNALGIERKMGELKPIESYQWADMKFHYNPDCAGPKDLSRQGSKTWRELKIQARTDLGDLVGSR